MSCSAPKAKDLNTRSYLLYLWVIKIKGIQLDYKLKQKCSSRFNQKMFGRISTRTKNNKRYSYYIPGVLDDVPYSRIFEGRLFISTTGIVDFDPIMKFCSEFKISTVSKDTSVLNMSCARDKWKFHSKERGFKIDWE